MAKRFTDTEKWNKNRWFRELSKDLRIFWLFICDNCDMVGVWEEDVHHVCRMWELEITKEEILEAFKKQIIVMPGGKKWWIIGFCDYQYGELKEDNIKNKPHQRYIAELKKHRLWIDYTKTIHSLKEKEKEEEEEKDLSNNTSSNGAEEKKEPTTIEGFYSIETLKAKCLADEKYCMLFFNIGIQDMVQIEKWLSAFNRLLEFKNETLKKEADYRRYFGHWIKFPLGEKIKPDDYSPIGRPEATSKMPLPLATDLPLNRHRK